MTPISATSTAPVASPLPSLNVQSSAFQNVLSEAVTADDTPPAVRPAETSSKPVPAVADIPIVPAGVWEAPQAMPADVLAVGTPVATGELTANLREAREALHSPAPATAPLPAVQNQPVAPRAQTQPGHNPKTDDPETDNLETGDAECDVGDKSEGTTLSAQTAPQPPVVPQMPVGIATAVPGKTKDPFRAEMTQANINTAPIDARQSGRKEAVNIALARNAGKHMLPDILEVLPTLQPDTANSGTTIMDTRLGLAPTASAPVVQLVSGQPMAEIRQLILRQDGEWIGALARDIVSQASHNNHLQFTLKPENLGLLDVAIISDNGQIDVRLETSTAAAAQVISADQARLIEDLRGFGLKLGQFEMTNRQNGNDQQRRPVPDHHSNDPASPTAQPKALSRAQGRFA